MKKYAKIALVYAGTVIGAGFASGQEVSTFFLGRGMWGLLGMIAAGLSFSVLAVMILSYCYRYELNTFQQYSDQVYGKPMSSFVQGFTVLFMFCAFIVMVAGNGALFHEFFEVPKTVGILVMAIVCFVVMLFHMQGIVKLNAFLTPIIIVGILVVSITALLLDAMSAFSVKGAVRGLADNWFTSALIYVSYNMITATVILVSLKQLAKEKKEALIGGCIGGGVLLIMAVLMWIVLYFNYIEIIPFEIPFLYIATKAGSAYLYALVLFCAMLTTAVASGFGFLEAAQGKIHIKRKLLTAGLCAVSIPFAYFGFSALVSELYTFFGVIGLAFLFVFLYKYIKG